MRFRLIPIALLLFSLVRPQFLYAQLPPLPSFNFNSARGSGYIQADYFNTSNPTAGNFGLYAPYRITAQQSLNLFIPLSISASYAPGNPFTYDISRVDIQLDENELRRRDSVLLKVKQKRDFFRKSNLPIQTTYTVPSDSTKFSSELELLKIETVRPSKPSLPKPSLADSLKLGTPKLKVPSVHKPSRKLPAIDTAQLSKPSFVDTANIAGMKKPAIKTPQVPEGPDQKIKKPGEKIPIDTAQLDSMIAREEKLLKALKRFKGSSAGIVYPYINDLAVAGPRIIGANICYRQGRYSSQYVSGYLQQTLPWGLGDGFRKMSGQGRWIVGTQQEVRLKKISLALGTLYSPGFDTTINKSTQRYSGTHWAKVGYSTGTINLEGSAYTSPQFDYSKNIQHPPFAIELKGQKAFAKLRASVFAAGKNVPLSYFSIGAPFARSGYRSLLAGTRKSWFKSQVETSVFYLVENTEGNIGKVQSLGASLRVAFENMPILMVSYQPSTQQILNPFDSSFHNASYKTFQAQLSHGGKLATHFIDVSASYFRQILNYSYSTQAGQEQEGYTLSLTDDFSAKANAYFTSTFIRSTSVNPVKQLFLEGGINLMRSKYMSNSLGAGMMENNLQRISYLTGGLEGQLKAFSLGVKGRVGREAAAKSTENNNKQLYYLLQASLRYLW